MVFEVGVVDYELADAAVGVDGCRILLLVKLLTAVAHTLNREYFSFIFHCPLKKSIPWGWPKSLFLS